MRCQQMRERMSLELDGQLPADEAHMLQAHLAECASCAEAWARWQEIADLFAVAPEVEPPEDLVARVLVRVRKPRLGALAVSLAVVGMGLALLAALAVVPLAKACAMTATTMQMPGVLGSVVGVLVSLMRAAAVLVEGAHLALRAVLTPRLLAVAAAHGALAAAALASWLRVAVFRRAPVRLAL